MMLSKERTFELIIIAIIVQVVILFSLIVTQKRKEDDINDESLIVKCFSRISIFIFGIFSGFAINGVSLFPIKFIKNYSFFIPKYFEKWYYMLSYKRVLQIHTLLSQDMDNMWREFHKVDDFVTELRGLYLGVFCLISAIIFFNIVTHKNQITNNGVYSGLNLYSWDDIEEYQREKYSRRLFKNKYYEITLNIQREKPVKWLQIGEIKKISTYVKEEDKEKVNKLLEDSI